MHALAKRTGVTPQGEAFLTCCLDPMHDKPIKDIDGWPDLETSPSLVRCIKQTMQISRPSVYPADQTWSCHVVSWPTLHTRPTTRGSMTGGLVDLSALVTPGPSIGGVRTYCSTTSTFNFLQAAIPGGAITEGPALTLDSQFDKGYGRLISSGIEICDTTATLYKQGYLTCYRQSQSRGPPISYAVIRGTSTGSITEEFIRCPPTTLDQAMLIPGTTQWEAKDGAYMVSSFTGSENSARPSNLMGFIIYDDLSGGQSPVGYPAIITDPSLSASPPFLYNGYANKHENINMSGMIFTGLSPQATLSLKWVCYYETFPGTNEPSELTLASPPCPYDPVALEYLKRVTSELPVAVPFGENPMGEWFWNVVDALSDLAPAIGSMFGPPGAILGAAVQHANRARKGPPQPPPKLSKR